LLSVLNAAVWLQSGLATNFYCGSEAPLTGSSHHCSNGSSKIYANEETF
jgi:hypothetical protein